MAGDDSSSSDSPEQSPPLESSPSPPPPSDSSSSAPPPDSSSSSPPPPSDSDNIRDSSSYASPPPESSLKSSSSPPPPDSSSGLSSPPPPDSSSESSPSPPPPDSSSGSSPPSPPPPPSDKSQSSPPPPSKSNGSNNNNEGGSKSSPSPSVEVWTPPTIVTQPVIPAIPIGESQTAPLNGTLAPSDQGPPPSSSSPSFGSSNNNTTAIIVGIVGVGGILLLLLIVCLLCMRKKKKKEGAHMPPYGWETGPSPQATQESQDHAIKMPPTSDTWGHTSGNHDSGGPYSGPQMNSSLEPSPSLTLGFIKSTFTYEELASATNNFENSKMLGQGGFGYVHKGVLPNGKEIAVKSLKSGSGQGEREFAAEVEIISRVHHRHLVSLVGFCIARGQRMLVYEFVPNDTLEHHLHKKGDPVLDFSTRLRVALGSAKGLGYLHEDCHPRIIHRDIKASNILLDENFEAMVADFGLAKLTTDTNTHVSTRVMGTFGYLAPEYASSGKLTEKSDVFSFGVMLLELITGRRPVDPNMQYMEDSLVDWSRPLLTKALETGNYDELADPRLERNYNLQEMQRMVACAAASIRHSAKKRPKMSQIVRALEGDVSLEDLNNDGTRGLGGLSSSEGTSSDYDTRAYSADLKKFRQMAFATQDFASSEYGGTTSEYGLNPSSSSSDNSREINTKEFNSSKI